MRASPLAFAIVLTLAGGAGHAESGRLDAPPKAQARSTWIVEFAEPPLASFRGETAGLDPKLKGLKATSPAVTGERRLDVDSAASRAYRGVLAELRAERLARAAGKIGRPLQPGLEWDVTTNGMTLELTAAEAAQLAKLPGVRQVQPDFVRQLATDSGPRWINADDVWAGTAGLAPNKGEGVVVGLIDSGINRTHPSFAATGPVDGYVHQNPRGHLFGRCAIAATAAECNNKLIGIYDFSTGDQSEEVDNGLDVSGHGSHVASTAIGNTLNFTFNVGNTSASRQLSGVAPHGNLISYKACEQRSNGSTCVGSWLVASINQAVEDGVDVINYSIGGGSRNPWLSPDALGMLAARDAGTVVVVAAGNEGPGPGSITGPGDAPWVIGAANATHDRAVVNKLADLAGGNSAPPSGGTLLGAGDTVGLPPRALVFDPQFPRCSIGDSLDDAASGASNPWQPGRFNGEIVVCERGVQARVAKSANVRLAGGGGMILVNTAAEGESIVADQHSIPTVHLGYSAGQQLRAWLASGSGHTGRITGASLESLPEVADILNASSGRGPSPSIDGIVKPDLAAPGTDIVAAQGTGTGFIGRSGTSMATPHIAGAAALVIAGRPNWSPSAVESALITTARASIRKEDGATPASAFDAGNGATDVAKALAAGLYFDVPGSAFRAANPAQGGVPRDLNRPSLAHENCFETCSIARRVTDLVGGGTWRVEFDLPEGAAATATPAQFTLTAGSSQIVTFDFDLRDPRFVGTWVDGHVRFIGNGGTVQTIPLTLFASPGSLPASIAIGGAGESGFADVAFSGLVSLPQAKFLTTDLAAPVTASRTLSQDPSRNDPYDAFADSEGTFFTMVTVPADDGSGGNYLLRAKTLPSSAYDLDLFVGIDLDNDGRPDEAEQLCSSAGPIDDEECELQVPADAASTRYWILVQNFDAGIQGDTDPTATDTVAVESLLVNFATGTAHELVATGPGHTASREAFKVRLAWNDPTLLPGERREGFLRLKARDDAAAELGPIPVTVTRSQSGVNAPALLAPNGTRHMRLAAGAAQDRLYLDVPASATGLTVSTAGSGEVDLYVARADARSSPTIAAAPARVAAQGTSIHPGATETVTLTGNALTPGRWYLTPVNAGTDVAEFDLSVALTHSQARPQPKYGAWYNPARSGAGAFLFPAGSAWGLAWYTYLQDGTPTWYLGVGPAPGPNDGVWRVDMERFNWDGSKATGTRVGQVQLELIDTDHVTFSWNLDGESGSEPMGWLAGSGCPQVNGAPAALTGLWYHPAKSGFGYSVIANAGLESNGAYFYDGQGVARWALGNASPFGAAMTLEQRTSGFCPLCDKTTPVAASIGTLTRNFTSATAGTMAVDLTLQPPLAGTWTVNLPVQRISDALVCP
jgi:subtilisin family serine protease